MARRAGWVIATGVLVASMATPVGASTGVARLTVRVEADSVGAQVRLDGRDRGAAPLTLDVPAGDHAIVLRWPGGTSRTDVSLRAGDHHVVVLTTEPIATLGTIVVDVPNVVVFVDGKARGRGPVSVPVRPGDHVVRVLWPDGRSDTRNVVVRAGDRLQLRPQ
jgi:hypothetical protein